MMMPGPSHGIAFLRWTARIWSILSILFIMAFAIGEGLLFQETAPFRLSELVGLLFFPVGILIGMLLGWWREGLGGIVTMVSLVVFYGISFFTNGRFPSGPYFALVAAPGLLFAINSLLRHHQASRLPPP
jgi:hypothetical protein